MAKSGGEIGYTPVPWFNGGLFDDATALPLDKDDLTLLIRVAELDWAEIDPSILGTLFERGLDPDKRSQLGAHYTDRTKIEMIIDPVIRRPLQAEWDAVRARIEALLTEAPTRGRRGAGGGKAGAQTLYQEFLVRLRTFRVLDPACGSGNFLYLSLQALKDLEHQAGIEVEALGLQREFPQVGPEAMLGIEINPYAAELARVSVWIGHIQWTRRHGYAAPSNPVLQPLDTIECRDAILTPEGKVAAWPKADVIVGNPPFLGDKAMIGVMGEDYVGTLRQAYLGAVPGGADLVCYWFELARQSVDSDRTQRVGLLATQAIRHGRNREVLNRIVQNDSIYEAWDDEPWVIDGASVRVSIVCFAPEALVSELRLDGETVSRIFSDLTSGNSDFTHLEKIRDSQGLSFIGAMKKAKFEISGDTAARWLQPAGNPNGRPNSDVLFPWVNGDDITNRPQNRWIIDFDMHSEQSASEYVLPFAHVLSNVKATRAQSNSDLERKYWWRLARRASLMLNATRRLGRFIGTPRLAKHRLFVWLEPPTIPDGQVVIIARDDDTIFGVIHSQFHEVWSLRLMSRHGDGDEGGRPRYTPTTTFETFPFPEDLTPNLPAASYANNPHAQAIAAAARELVEKRDLWLNPPDLVDRVPEVVPGYPDRIIPRNARAAATLKSRTLTNLYNTRGKPEGAWLDSLHRKLDDAVAAAYGWPADLSDDEILARLLQLNLARAKAQGT